ncbi:hypothetical protein [Chryseobacterium indoltheticum]
MIDNNLELEDIKEYAIHELEKDLPFYTLFLQQKYRKQQFLSR